MSLFSHMQKASFLMTWLKSSLVQGRGATELVLMGRGVFVKLVFFCNDVAMCYQVNDE